MDKDLCSICGQKESDYCYGYCYGEIEWKHEEEEEKNKELQIKKEKEKLLEEEENIIKYYKSLLEDNNKSLLEDNNKSLLEDNNKSILEDNNKNPLKEKNNKSSMKIYFHRFVDYIEPATKKEIKLFNDWKLNLILLENNNQI